MTCAYFNGIAAKGAKKLDKDIDRQEAFLTRQSRNQRGPGRTPRTLRDSQLFIQFRLVFTRR